MCKKIRYNCAMKILCNTITFDVVFVLFLQFFDNLLCKQF